MPFIDREIRRRIALVVALASASAIASAQQIDWYSIDGGGGVSTDGTGPNGLVLVGVIGQSDTARMTGGSLSLSGGFLPLPAAPEGIFSDSFETVP